MLFNPILRTDSYKLSHPWQFPPGTEATFHYAEARKGARFPSTLFFGLQAFLLRYLSTIPSKHEVRSAARFAKLHGLPFDERGWMHIHHLGYYPLKIRAVPEGTLVPVGNVMFTVESTDPKAFWLPGWVETQILRAAWYPSTVATISHTAKGMIWEYLSKTSDNPDAFIESRLHDFGARGVSSAESAELGGMAHLVNFQGSDTMEGIMAARIYYHANEMPAFSIPAMEHSTVTAWGEDREADAYRNMLDQFKDAPFLAAVSDSYDIFGAVSDIWGVQLRERVREGSTVVVVRPDSGDPYSVVPEILRRLDKAYGYTVNSRGFRVLNNVAVIQGDGMDLDSLKMTLEATISAEYSVENVAFGMGGGLLQKLNRDTQRWGYKLSAIKIDGQWIGVRKSPLGDKAKASKSGRLDLRIVNGKFQTHDTLGVNPQLDSDMIDVFENGDLKTFQSFNQVRHAANKTIRDEW